MERAGCDADDENPDKEIRETAVCIQAPRADALCRRRLRRRRRSGDVAEAEIES